VGLAAGSYFQVKLIPVLSTETSPDKHRSSYTAVSEGAVAGDADE